MFLNTTNYQGLIQIDKLVRSNKIKTKYQKTKTIDLFDSIKALISKENLKQSKYKVNYSMALIAFTTLKRISLKLN